MGDDSSGYRNYTTDDVAARVTSPATTAVAIEGGLPGGTLLSYGPPWTIVPDDAVPSIGQVREREFLHGLAAEIAARLPGSPGHGDDRAMLEGSIEAMLLLGREKVVPSTLEEWLRDRLSVPATQQLSVEQWYETFFRVMNVSSFVNQLELWARVVAIPEDEVAERHTPDGDAEDTDDTVGMAVAATMQKPAELVAQEALCLAGVAPCLLAARAPKPPGAMKPTGLDGQAVHFMIQEHYLLTHPGHTVMMESLVHMLGFRGSILSIGQMSTTANPLLGALRFALGTIQEATKLPDILDYTTGEAYEIKPRAQIRSGRRQLCTRYIAPFNLVAPKLGLKPLRPGSTWLPSPAYWVPPMNIALTLQCPGLIIYDLFSVVPPQLKPQAVRLPVLNRAAKRQLTSQQIAMLVIALALLVVFFLWTGGLLTPAIAFFARMLMGAALAGAAI
jgi:hypothetical protein